METTTTATENNGSVAIGDNNNNGNGNSSNGHLVNNNNHYNSKVVNSSDSTQKGRRRSPKKTQTEETGGNVTTTTNTSTTINNADNNNAAQNKPQSSPQAPQQLGPVNRQQSSRNGSNSVGHFRLPDRLLQIPPLKQAWDYSYRTLEYLTTVSTVFGIFRKMLHLFWIDLIWTWLVAPPLQWPLVRWPLSLADLFAVAMIDLFQPPITFAIVLTQNLAEFTRRKWHLLLDRIQWTKEQLVSLVQVVVQQVLQTVDQLARGWFKPLDNHN